MVAVVAYLTAHAGRPADPGHPGGRARRPPRPSRPSCAASACVLAASAMGLVRGIVGFLTFLLLFDLRDDPTWHMGAVLALTGVGALVGSAVAPALRRSFSEERMLMMVLGVAVAGGRHRRLAGRAGGQHAPGRHRRGGVHRRTPGVRLARAARRARCQPRPLVRRVRAPVPAGLGGRRDDPRADLRSRSTVGFLFIAGVAGFALFSYVAGQRAAHRAHVDRPPAGPGHHPRREPSPRRAATRELGDPADCDPTLVRPARPRTPTGSGGGPHRDPPRPSGDPAAVADSSERAEGAR